MPRPIKPAAVASQPGGVASKLPFTLPLHFDGVGVNQSNEYKSRVFKLSPWNGDDTANAQQVKAGMLFIIQAVNSHAALVQALKECRRELGYMGSEFDGLVAEADAALKLAGEEI